MADERKRKREMRRIRGQLARSGIDLTEPVYTSTAHQCYGRGPFAGYSIGNLIEALIKYDGLKIKFISDNYN